LMGEELERDAALMLRVKEGDTAAFADLVDRYKGPVVSFVFRMLRDQTEAEDIAQTTFFQAYKSAGRYHAKAKFSTWLFTIAHRLTLNELRRRSRHPADSLEAPHPEDPEGHPQEVADKKATAPPEALLQSELADHVDAALDALPANQREALLLCRQEDLSYEEISEILGCSLSATKSLIFRGREAVKGRLKAYLKTGEWNP
jgi:RNA polymerase sigma-70 factor, ECF subfamily